MKVDRETIARAYQGVAGYVRQTPILEAGENSLWPGASVALKLECLQHSGSFKVRGVFTHLLDSDRREKFVRSGVVAASGGNHGAAVAYAAQRLGIEANIFVPEISSEAKVQRIRGYGAKVHVGGQRYVDALQHSEVFEKESGCLSVHAYDQEATLVGQGTTALEWQKQDPSLDTVLIAVGGGGLIGGMAAWFREQVKVVACEPDKSCAYHRAREAGRPVKVSVDGIAADSLGAETVGSLMFPIARSFVDSSVVVKEEAIARAQYWLWTQMQVVAEPGGATALAALLSGAYKTREGERVGVLVCGGNASSLPTGRGARNYS